MFHINTATGPGHSPLYIGGRRRFVPLDIIRLPLKTFDQHEIRSLIIAHQAALWPVKLHRRFLPSITRERCERFCQYISRLRARVAMSSSGSSCTDEEDTEDVENNRGWLFNINVIIIKEFNNFRLSSPRKFNRGRVHVDGLWLDYKILKDDCIQMSGKFRHQHDDQLCNDINWLDRSWSMIINVNSCA